MDNEIKTIIAELALFCTEGDYLARLRSLTDRLLDTGKPEEGLEAMLALIERYPDEELGSPGPLIHTIEKCRHYEEALLASLSRQPATMTLWMLHRLMKQDSQIRYRETLRELLNHPKASEMIKEDAEIIISWHE